MPINQPLSDVPRRKAEQGLPPSRNPFVVQAVARKFYELNDDKAAEHAIPEAGAFRMSYASKRCDRQLYYAMSRTPESDPVTIADIWRFALGQLVHDALQEVRKEAYPDAHHELVVDLRPLGIDGSGRIDIVEGDTVIELKSINGYSFKMIATTMRGAPQGPRFGAVVQAALGAAAVNAGGAGPDMPTIDKVVVGYLSLELVGPGLVDIVVEPGDEHGREIARFGAEWHFTMDELMPLVEHEVARVGRIQRDVANGRLPARALDDPEYPAGAVVTTPSAKNATWQLRAGEQIIDSGSTWMCGYCSHRQQCSADGPGDSGDTVEI